MPMPLTMPPEETERLSAGDVGDRERKRLGAEGVYFRNPFRPTKAENYKYKMAGERHAASKPGAAATAGPTSVLPEPPGTLEAAMAQETANQANVGGTGVAYDKAGMVPSHIQRLPMPGSSATVYRNDPAMAGPAQPMPGHGEAIYSDTSYGARPQGVDEAIAQHGQSAGGTAFHGDVSAASPGMIPAAGGQTLPAPPPTASFDTSLANIDPATGLSTGDAARLQEVRAAGAGQGGGLPAPPAGRAPEAARPDYAGQKATTIQKREAKMALNSLMDDVKRGRLSGREARALMPAFLQQQGNALGMTEKDIGALFSKDYGTAQQAATAANQQAASLDQEAMRQAGENRRTNIDAASEIAASQLPRPPKFKGFALTDEDKLGNKTQRPYVYDETSGQDRQQDGEGGGQMVIDDAPPMAGAEKAPDGHWYIRKDGKYIRVEA